MLRAILLLVSLGVKGQEIVQLTSDTPLSPITNQIDISEGKSCSVVQSSNFALFTCEELQIVTGTTDGKGQKLKYNYSGVQQSFLMSDAEDVFLLAKMLSTKITVLELDIGFSRDQRNWLYDQKTDTWNYELEPVALPLFELTTPVYGELRYLSLSKVKGFGLLLVESSVIIFEFNNKAPSYLQSTGFGNGLIVRYFQANQSANIVSFSLNEEKYQLFLCDAKGKIYQLAFNLVPKPGLGLKDIKISDVWSPSLQLQGKFTSVAALGDLVVLIEQKESLIEIQMTLVVMVGNEIVAKVQGSNLNQQLGKTIWLGYDSKSQKLRMSQAIIAISSQAEGKTFLNLFKIVKDQSPRMIFYAKIPLQATFIASKIISTAPTVSLLNGSLIQVTVKGLSGLMANQLRFCSVDSYYNQASNQCVTCQAQSVSLSFQQQRCTSCEVLPTENTLASFLRKTLCDAQSPVTESALETNSAQMSGFLVAICVLCVVLFLVVILVIVYSRRGKLCKKTLKEESSPAKENQRDTQPTQIQHTQMQLVQDQSTLSRPDICFDKTENIDIGELELNRERRNPSISSRISMNLKGLQEQNITDIPRSNSSSQLANIGMMSPRMSIYSKMTFGRINTHKRNRSEENTTKVIVTSANQARMTKLPPQKFEYLDSEPQLDFTEDSDQKQRDHIIPQKYNTAQLHYPSRSFGPGQRIKDQAVIGAIAEFDYASANYATIQERDLRAISQKVVKYNIGHTRTATKHILGEEWTFGKSGKENVTESDNSVNSEHSEEIAEEF